MNKNLFSQYIGSKENFQFTWPIHENYYLNSRDELIEILKKRDEFGTVSSKSIEELSQRKDKLFLHHLDLQNIDPSFAPHSPLNEKDLLTKEADGKDLFLKFANIDSNNNSQILEFVKEYSYLESGLYYSVNRFQKEVKRANKLIEIYAFLIENNIKKLRKQIKMFNNYSNQNWRFTVKNIKNEFNIKNDLNELEEEGIINLFVNYIFSNIHQVVNGNIVPVFKKIQYKYDGFEEYIDTPNSAKQFKIRPGWYCKNLLTVLYLQFYFIITENKAIDYCVYCNKPFLKERKGNNYHEQCRKNAYKTRKKKAFKLWNKDHSAEEIYEILKPEKSKKAERIGGQLSTIEGWTNKWKEYKKKAFELWENGNSAKEIYEKVNTKSYSELLLRDIEKWISDWEEQ